MELKQCQECKSIFHRKFTDGIEYWKVKKFCGKRCSAIYGGRLPNKGRFKKGNIQTEKQRLALYLANKGRIPTEETRRKIGNAQKGEKNHQWIGGNWRYWHNLARKRMIEYIGRKLEKGEVVHHKNHQWFGEENNRIENLQLMTNSDHIKHHQLHLFSPATKKGYKRIKAIR